MKKKVVIFVQDGVGGAERMSILIGKNLDKDIYNVCFCLIGTSAESSISDFIPKDMKVYKIGFHNPIYLMWKMLLFILKEHPFAIFSSVYNLSNKFLPFRKFYPYTRVIIRCDNYLFTYSRKQRTIIEKFYGNADHIIAQTKEMKDELLKIGIDAAKIVVLLNPVDKQIISKKIDGAPNPYSQNGMKHIVAVGRFNPQKGFDLLVDAFIELRNHREDADLTIVGDTSIGNGVLYKEIMKKAHSAGLEKDIKCVGYKDNPYVYLKYADCFVLSSRYEGLPNVLIEALYLGTPVAAFKCIPIIEQIIEEGKTGFCAEKENVYSLESAMVNSLKLGRVVSKYKSATIEDFTKLFK